MIRTATLSDVGIIIQIAEKSWALAYREILSAEQYDYMLGKYYTSEAIGAAIKAGKQVFLLYIHEDKPVGFISYELSFPESTSCKIHKLYILPDAQGLGVGKKLIERVKEMAVQHDCNMLTLNVNKYNKALHFYEKSGFQNVQAEVIDIGNGYVMDDFVMQKPI